MTSLLRVGPSWVGGIELLSTVGVDGSAAAFLSGLYAWGRGAFSAAIQVRNARRGSLAVGGPWLTNGPDPITEQRQFTAAYPTPAWAEFSLCRAPQAV